MPFPGRGESDRDTGPTLIWNRILVVLVYFLGSEKTVDTGQLMRHDVEHAVLAFA
jgi:hypothetical protein